VLNNEFIEVPFWNIFIESYNKFINIQSDQNIKEPFLCVAIGKEARISKQRSRANYAMDRLKK